MKEVDQLPEDAALVESVYDAQGNQHRKSRTHGRTQTPAEVAVRLLMLKHVRNWCYSTLAQLGQVIGPEVIGELHERLMELARERAWCKDGR